jgi:hypothetical protein
MRRQDFQGSAEVALALVVNGPGHSWTGSLGEGLGELTIRAEEIPDPKAVVSFKLELCNLPKPGVKKSLPNPFIRFSRIDMLGAATACYRTKVMMGCLNAEFQFEDVSLAVLAAGSIDSCKWMFFPGAEMEITFFWGLVPLRPVV